MIIRSPKKESNFYVLDKSISEDSRLSWQARGVLVYLLGKPDNWTVSVQHLINQTKSAPKRTGRDGVYAILRELEAAGYITREPSRGSNGEFEGLDYHVSEHPFTDNPLTDNPLTDNTTLTSTEYKQGLSNTNTASDDAGVKSEGKKKPTLLNKYALIDMGVDEQVADDWLAVRKGKRMPLTETAVKRMQQEAGKAGITFADAVTRCAENSWGGFKAKYIEDSKPATRYNDVPYEKIFSLYEKICPSLGRVIYKPENRYKGINDIWFLNQKHQSLDFWEWYFRKIEASNFLTGRSSNLMIGFDWIVKMENFNKIIEGLYDDR